MPIKPLPIEALRRRCDPKQFAFKTTEEIESNLGIFGQPRGIRALEFGIGIRSSGYNIFVLGETSTDHTTSIRRFLKERTRNKPTPDDWVYVHNFKVNHQPRAIEFQAGQGAQFKKQMNELVSSLREDLPRAFSTEEYEEEVDTISDRVELKQNLLMHELEKTADEEGFRIIRTAAGPTVTPTLGGEVMNAQQFSELTLDEQGHLDKMQIELEMKLAEVVNTTRQLKISGAKDLDELDKRVARQAISPQVDALIDTYRDHEEVLLYLAEVHDDVLDNLHDFRPDPQNPERVADLSRYDVNMFVDNSRTEGAPVIVEQNPSYSNLIGRIEYDMQDGFLLTHFDNIKPGSLHQANGGYLIIEAGDLLGDMLSWEALKRSIKSAEIPLQPTNMLDGGRVLAKSIDPEAIPLDIKIILLGNAHLYYSLYEQDEDFNELFKVKADFSSDMPRDLEHEVSYAEFVAARCKAEKLSHFDRSAVARLVEYGSEVSGQKNKLSAQFGMLADLIREACFWSVQGGATVVTADDVQKALDERVYRSNKIETLIDEEISDGMIIISTEGKVVGQANGLSVIDMGDHAFGRPSRITGRTFAGSGGVVHIERETSMADPIHSKGVLTLSGYMGGTYAQETPLSFSASLTFEQNYAGVGGDSASMAELLVLLSSLSEVPLKQGIAVTGSINQRGTIQAIGGVTEKIEGFFRVCMANGLTGDHGVIIPRANVNDLMLADEVIEAVENGLFSIWAVETIDEALEIITGKRAGKMRGDGSFAPTTVHGRVAARLDAFANKGDSAESDEEDDDDE